MRTLLSALTLLPAALAAQAPAVQSAPAAAPAAQAPAPSLVSKLNTLRPVVANMRLQDPEGALAKVEAAIPLPLPAFDKTDFHSAQLSMDEYNALTGLYRLAASSADAAGQWEKAKNFAEKAKATAQLTYEDASPSFVAFQDSWKKALAEAQKNLDELDSLNRIEKPTADQSKRLDFLKVNQPTFQKNKDNGQRMIDALDARLKDLKDQPSDFDSYLANMDSRLKSEADNLEKFKGDKQKFVEAALKTADDYKDKSAEATFLRRLLVFDPASKAAQHKLDVVLGKAVDEPAKPVRRHKKGH